MLFTTTVQTVTNVIGAYYIFLTKMCSPEIRRPSTIPGFLDSSLQVRKRQSRIPGLQSAGSESEPNAVL